MSDIPHSMNGRPNQSEEEKQRAAKDAKDAKDGKEADKAARKTSGDEQERNS